MSISRKCDEITNFFVVLFSRFRTGIFLKFRGHGYSKLLESWGRLRSRNLGEGGLQSICSILCQISPFFIHQYNLQTNFITYMDDQVAVFAETQFD